LRAIASDEELFVSESVLTGCCPEIRDRRLFRCWECINLYVGLSVGALCCKA